MVFSARVQLSQSARSLRADEASVDKRDFYPELVKVLYTCARVDLDGNLSLLLIR